MTEKSETLRNAAQYFARDDLATLCWSVDDHRGDHDITLLCHVVELSCSAC